MPAPRQTRRISEESEERIKGPSAHAVRGTLGQSLWKQRSTAQRQVASGGELPKCVLGE